MYDPMTALLQNALVSQQSGLLAAAGAGTRMLFFFRHFFTLVLRTAVPLLAAKDE